MVSVSVPATNGIHDNFTSSVSVSNMDNLTEAHFQEVNGELVNHRVLQWTDFIESCDLSDPNTAIHSPSKVSADGYETSNDSFYTASDGESDASSATLGRSTELFEPVISEYLIDTPQQQTREDAIATVNPHPFLTINANYAREAIYIYEMMKEGVMDDQWNMSSCVLTRELYSDNPAFSLDRVGWHCLIDHDPDGVLEGEVVVLFMPDSDFVEKINQGEVVFDEAIDKKPASLVMQVVEPDFYGPEKRLAGRVLAWKVCGSVDSVWMDRQGHPIDRDDTKVIPNIIHLLK
jgi:hypothetical protein